MLKVCDLVPDTFEINLRRNTALHLAMARAAKSDILVDLLTSPIEVCFTSTPDAFDRGSADIAWETHRLFFEVISRHDADAFHEALAYHMSTATPEAEVKAPQGVRAQGLSRWRTSPPPLHRHPRGRLSPIDLVI